jgi:peptide/nickel transport system permease protein
VIPYMFRTTGFKSLEKPSGKHWLGVDESTRDVGVRLLYGTRISLTIGVIAVAIYVTIGIILGSLAGFFAGKIDIMIQRLIEIVMSIPALIIILVLVAFLEKPSIFHIMLVIGLVRWTGVARLVRGEFYRLRGQDFVTSAVALGYPTHRIIFKHILPNAMGPVLVSATFGVAGAILLESTLSFLGLGDLSAPSWGQTLSEGYSSGAWHLILAPGFAIFVTVSLLNLVGEGLRDALDPKMRK